MKEMLTTPEYQIKQLKQDPNWETANNESTNKAIRTYEVMGACWASARDFWEAGLYEIEEAICREMR